MKWFKLYSIGILILSVGLIIGSFFIMDMLPMLYEFYMGHEISALKMDKLVSFGDTIIFDLKLYSIFLFVTFSVMYFMRTIQQYLILLALFLTLHFLFIAEIGEYIIFRRFYQLFIMLPLLWLFFDFFKFKKESYKNKITHTFLYITLLCIVLPGLHLPPFFGGIGGWTVEIDKSKPFPIDGVFLVREDGEEIRYSRAIVSPINFVTRLNVYMERAHPEELTRLLKFYEEVYKKRYDILEKGLIPSQHILGKFSYPVHNPPGDFDYSKFPPSSIKEIKLSRRYYSWDKTFIKEDVIAREEW